MEQFILIVVLGALAIAAVSAIGPRVRIAGPLLLVVIGIGVSLLPFVPPIVVDPEIILTLVLPPLLYAAAVALPAVEFRRDFMAIAGLAFALVVVSTVALGFFFAWAIPGIGIFLALALGAILSPTDAVATSIVKRLGVSRRVVTMLEGESLLNDATALVILRTAIAAAGAGAFAIGEFLTTFTLGVLVATIIGVVVGYVSLRIRALIKDPAANTALGLVVPFVAFVPTEHLGGSGLVAAVVAGITTGQRAARTLTAEQRLSDALNWNLVERVLESAVFLIMGLELSDIVDRSMDQQGGPPTALLLAAVALVIILVVRAGYVSGLVFLLGRRGKRVTRARLDAISDRLDQGEFSQSHPKRAGKIRSRLRSATADLDYYQATPLTWRHGSIIVWAGMRGVVTLAAAQTLPRDAPERDILILIAFLVALISLLMQGLTLPAVTRLVRLPADDEALPRKERRRLDAELRAASKRVLNDPNLRRRNGEPFNEELRDRAAKRYTPTAESAAHGRGEIAELRILMITAMRERLTQLRREGYSSAVLREVLAELDAEEISLRLREDED